MAIKVEGQAKLKVSFSVNLEMTEAEFESKTEREQDEIIENAINWHDALPNSETDEIDVWDYAEIK